MSERLGDTDIHQEMSKLSKPITEGPTRCKKLY